MDYKVEEIEGIGPVYGQKLAGAKIVSTADFLRQCGTPAGRREVGKQTGITTKLLLKWANHADLMRIRGIGPEFSELLEAAGVDTVKELRHRRADSLAAKLKSVREEKHLTRAVPTEEQVRGWIEQARGFQPTIQY